MFFFIFIGIFFNQMFINSNFSIKKHFLEEENQVESCVSSETIEKDNEDPGEEAEENYAPQNIRHKFEKFPSSMMEKLKMMDFAHAMKMNHQRRLQKKYHNMIATQRFVSYFPVFCFKF